MMMHMMQLNSFGTEFNNNNDTCLVINVIPFKSVPGTLYNELSTYMVCNLVNAPHDFVESG
jgi:hypothetical protein